MDWNPLPHPDAEIHPAMPKELRERREEETDVVLGCVKIVEDGDPEPDSPYQCWCGAVGRPSELCDVSGLESGCGGLGVLNCYCGGDLCVCHHHGEVDCPGCPECEERDDEEEAA